MTGDIIPLRWAQSSRYGGRLRPESARVSEKEESTTLYGTAFGLAEHWALTCAHVVKNRPHESLSLFGSQGSLDVEEILLHPDDSNNDLALLRTKQPIAELLSCTALQPPMVKPISRGYLGEDEGWGGRELRFESRGHANPRYDDFRITDAFDLAGDMAAPGFSGAPLLDEGTGSVIGLISGGNLSRGRSWAVPLSAAATWPTLRDLLDWNDSHLSRFGPLVNYLGALEVCQIQSAKMVASMRRSRKFVPDLDVPRSAMRNVIASFRKAEQPALAIVGDANLGKTWFLCQLASDLSEAPVLLMFASTLDHPRTESFEKFLSQSLIDGWEDKALAVPAVTTLAEACSRAGRPLFVLLDGINEVSDIARFSSNWIPNAVGFCRDHSLKLIMTCRFELWPMFARAIPDPRDSLFSSGENTQQKRATDPESFFVRQSVFTPSEASAARETYGIAIPVMENIGNHPLLFRIARDLHLQSLPPTFGRYKLLQSFVDRQLDEVCGKVPGSSGRSLKVGFQCAAGLMGRGGSGRIHWDEAKEIFGGDATLNAALEVGLLTAVENSIRFAFDQVAEVLRIVTVDPGSVFRAIAAREVVQKSEFADACFGLLQIEANGDEDLFLAGCDALLPVLDALDQLYLHPYSLLETVLSLAQALPPTRSSTVEKLFISISRYCLRTEFSVTLAAQWIFEAPLPANVRARLLVDIAPLQDSFPLRRKDWLDPTRRPVFEKNVDEPNSRYPAALLNRLMKEDPATVRPVLVAALNDRRTLKSEHEGYPGEATVATMCAGILFHRRVDDPNSLYGALLEFEYEYDTSLLLSELAKFDAAAFAAKAIDRVEQNRNISRALRVLEYAGDHLDPNSRSNVVSKLGSLISKVSDPVAAAIVRVIRVLDPSDLPSWDWLVQHESDWYDNKIPTERFTEALCLARRNPELGMELMEHQEGPADEQRAMALLATEFLAARNVLPIKLGSLAESKLNAMEDDVRYKGWSDYILKVALEDEDTRTALFYPAFRNSPNNGGGASLRNTVRESILGAALTNHEIGTITRIIVRNGCNYNTSDMFNIWLRVRLNDLSHADLAIMNALGEIESAYSSRERELAILVFEYWRTLNDGEHSLVSRLAVESELPVERIFSHEFRLSVHNKFLELFE